MTGATSTFADAKVGTGKSVNISGLSLSGSAAGNYTLTQPTAQATITSAGLTVTGITAANKVYDGTTTATINTSSASLTGVIPIDAGNVALLTAGATGSFVDANVGTGKVVTITGLALSGSAAANYALTQPTTQADILPVMAITITNPSSGWPNLQRIGQPQCLERIIPSSTGIPSRTPVGPLLKPSQELARPSP